MIDRFDPSWIMRMYSLQLSMMKVYIDRVMFTLPYTIYIYIYTYVHIYVYVYIYAKEIGKVPQYSK